MEKKRQNIDNFFKENLSGSELSKKEGNWELLNHLLNEQERKKKKRRWLIWIFSFLIMLTSGLLILLPGKKSTENIKGSITQSNIPVPAESNSFKNITDKSIAAVPQFKNEIDKQKKVNSGNLKFENNSLINENTNASHSIVVKKEPANSIEPQITIQQPSAISQSEINSTSQQLNSTPRDSAKTDVEQTTHSEILAANQSQAGDSVKPNTSVTQTANENLFSSDSLLIKAVERDSLSAITKNNSPGDSSAKQVPAKTKFLNFNFYTGVNIYSTSSAFTNKENISPIAGLEFTHSLSSKFSIGLGGLYSLQGGYHLDDTVIVSQKTYFLDVSENVSEQTIHIRQLQKLCFPLTFYYAVTNKHIVSGAIQSTYLVNTKGNYTEKNTLSGITNESQKDNVKGYMDGIRSTNIAVSLGYQIRLSETFDWSAHVTRELKEPYIKEYFYGINNHPAWTFQTFLIVKF